MDKAFTINDTGCSIRCRLYCDNPRNIDSVVVFCHGFGGYKDSRSARRFAEKLTAKQKKAAFLAFDWPAHGEDARKKLILSDCLAYLNRVLSYVSGHYAPDRVYAYATSFGGYALLAYLLQNSDTSASAKPEAGKFAKIALRCPAVNMLDSLQSNILTEEDKKALAKGKDVLAGFDRKVKIGKSFLEELRASNVEQADFRPQAGNMLILHGTKDEIIPFGPVEQFALRNGISFLPVENADHRFVDPQKMDLAIHEILSFFYKSA